MTTLNVNGNTYQVNADPDTPLLWVLRDIIGLTGTKYGCGIEVCGACTVLINGQPERSCNKSFSEVQGQAITTIEGLSPDSSHPLQKAWVELQVPQCGYCQSGMLMAAAGAMNQGHIGASEIIPEISNVCVCGTYMRIRSAIQRAAGA